VFPRAALLDLKLGNLSAFEMAMRMDFLKLLAWVCHLVIEMEVLWGFQLETEFHEKSEFRWEKKRAALETKKLLSLASETETRWQKEDW